MASQDRPPRELDTLKRAILALGHVRPGTVVKRMTRCGNPKCRCAKGGSKRHGPYYQWTSKVRGKTVTLRLTEEQARKCSEWTRNHRKLAQLVRRMEDVSLKATNEILGVDKHAGL